MNEDDPRRLRSNGDILGRRRFVQGVGAAGSVAALGSQGCAATTPAVSAGRATLSGSQFD